MIDKIELFKNISSHFEIEDSVSNSISISYIHFQAESNLEEQLELKKEVRDLAIEAIFDTTKVNEYLDAKDDYDRSINPFDSNISYGTMSSGTNQTYANIIGPKIKTVLASPKSMISIESLRDEIIQEWIKQSKISKCTANLKSNGTLNQVSKNGTDPHAIYRRFISKCIHCGSMIAVTGRIGSATTILANREVLNLFPELNNSNHYMFDKHTIGNMVFEFTDLVPKDRLYIIRSLQDKDIKKAGMSPIISVFNSTLNQYYLVVLPIISGNCVELEIV